MTSTYFNGSNGPVGDVIDGFVYPQFLGNALRAPTTQDIYNSGTRWQDNSVNPPVQYYTTGAGRWYELPNAAFGVSSVTGTANQITASPTTGNVILSIPEVFIAPGSIASTTTMAAGTSLSAGTTVTAGTGITATTGDIVASMGNITAILNITSYLGNIAASGGSVSAATTVTGGTGVTATTGAVTASAGNLVATLGNLNLNGAASKININVATTTSASAGTGTLTSGTLTIATTAATTNSIIMVSYIIPEASAGTLSANCTVNGTLVITSSDGTDSTSTVQWFLIN